MYREAGKDEADRHPSRYGYQQVHPPVEGQLVHQLRHQGRQAGAEEPRIDVPAQLRAVDQGIGGRAEEDGQDVHRILSPEAVAHIDEDRRHGEPGELDLLPAQQPHPHAHHQHAVQESGPVACQLEVVRDQRVPGDYDSPQAPDEGQRPLPLLNHAGHGRHEQHRHGEEAECLQFLAFQFLSECHVRFHSYLLVFHVPFFSRVFVNLAYMWSLSLSQVCSFFSGS